MINENEITVWQSIEVYCIASGFKYNDYVDIHTKYPVKGALVCEKAYYLLEQFFDAQVENDTKDS